jgi:hypothetical protein
MSCTQRHILPSCNEHQGLSWLSPGVIRSEQVTFFDDGYLRIWGQLFTEENNAKQAEELWSMLDLKSGCQILDAPCGWGRLSRPLALVQPCSVLSVGTFAALRGTQSLRLAAGAVALSEA